MGIFDHWPTKVQLQEERSPGGWSDAARAAALLARQRNAGKGGGGEDSLRGLASRPAAPPRKRAASPAKLDKVLTIKDRGKPAAQNSKKPASDKPAGKPVSVVGDVFDEDMSDADIVADAAKSGVKATRVSKSGPGGGAPEYRFAGPLAAVRKYMKERGHDVEAYSEFD